MTDEYWREEALCARIDPELWFPEIGVSQNSRTIKAAFKTCRRCPVSAECLRYAVKHGMSHGIWGGLTPNQRRDITLPAGRRPRLSPSPESCGTPSGAKRHYRNNEKPCPACRQAKAKYDRQNKISNKLKRTNA